MRRLSRNTTPPLRRSTRIDRLSHVYLTLYKFLFSTVEFLINLSMSYFQAKRFWEGVTLDTVALRILHAALPFGLLNAIDTDRHTPLPVEHTVGTCCSDTRSCRI